MLLKGDSLALIVADFAKDLNCLACNSIAVCICPRREWMEPVCRHTKGLPSAIPTVEIELRLSQIRPGKCLARPK